MWVGPERGMRPVSSRPSPHRSSARMASPQQLAKLHAVVAAAQAAQRKWRVPASVTLAQWIFESSWGTSELARTANNYFGIKAHQGAAPGTYCEFITPEFVDGQREEKIGRAHV